MAQGQGVEPRFTGPEPAVLPLDDPRTLDRINTENYCSIQNNYNIFYSIAQIKIHTKNPLFKKVLKNNPN